MKGNVKEYKRHDSRHVCIPTCILLRPMFPKDVSLPNIYATVYKMTILLISDPLNKLRIKNHGSIPRVTVNFCSYFGKTCFWLK